MSIQQRVGIAVIAAAALAAALHLVRSRTKAKRRYSREKQSFRTELQPLASVADLVGHTALLEVKSLSTALGCRVLAKCEWLNPGGSSKDRVALQMILDAEASGRLRPGGWIVEGTSGSTGVSLALLARALGYRCHVVMPDDQAVEKQQLLRTFGAHVQLVKPASITNPDHYVNVARRVADELCKTESAVFCDQFENLSNAKAHYCSTGPEIWSQTGGSVTAFVMGAGTGGTLAGVARFLRERWAAAGVAGRVLLVDPPGSSLYNAVAHGVAYAPQQSERSLKRHRYDTIIEGVGIDRRTANFDAAAPLLDGALRCSDAEAVEMSRYLLR